MMTLNECKDARDFHRGCFKNNGALSAQGDAEVLLVLDRLIEIADTREKFHLRSVAANSFPLESRADGKELIDRLSCEVWEMMNLALEDEDNEKLILHRLSWLHGWLNNYRKGLAGLAVPHVEEEDEDDDEE